MPSLRKIPFTKPIPAGAEIFTREGRRFARWIDGKKRPREAEVTEDGARIRQLSRKWYGSYTDADGVERCVSLATDKTAAGQMLAELVRRAELGKAGIVDHYEQHRKRPLCEHVAEYEAYLLGKGDGRQHARDAAARVRRTVQGASMVFIADLSLSRVQTFLADLAASRPVLPPVDAAKVAYTKAELAAALGFKPRCIGPRLRRWGLPAAGTASAAAIPAIRSWRWSSVWPALPARRRSITMSARCAASPAGLSATAGWVTTHWPP